MHQREEESTVAGRTVRRKPFYAAEVIMKGIELRAMLATFPEPLKQDVQITASAQRSNYRKHVDLPITTSTSTWYDIEDFVELDWLSSSPPVLHLLPLATFPHFTYFKRNTSLPGVFPQTSKFGSEHSHICLLGKEQCKMSCDTNTTNIKYHYSCFSDADVTGICKSDRTQKQPAN